MAAGRAPQPHRAALAGGHRHVTADAAGAEGAGLRRLPGTSASSISPTATVSFFPRVLAPVPSPCYTPAPRECA
ncbi:hypothetical protein NITMOv2_1875 [Nitrospira moscoviensis]|uniref:Uncharacterized protein n=1 Tax=Nitrospira moscoviensis TaxID=42253 RepID=A0A0K2GBG4_NITMO|nr:hypothetical protein NITMOv2_1875 [Nitrospira moscoviensis]